MSFLYNYARLTFDAIYDIICPITVAENHEINSMMRGGTASKKNAGRNED